MIAHRMRAAAMMSTSRRRVIRISLIIKIGRYTTGGITRRGSRSDIRMTNHDEHHHRDTK